MGEWADQWAAQRVPNLWGTVLTGSPPRRGTRAGYPSAVDLRRPQRTLTKLAEALRIVGADAGGAEVEGAAATPAVGLVDRSVLIVRGPTP